MKLRLVAAIVAGLATIAVTTSQATAALVWAAPNDEGVVEICFESDDLAGQLLDEAGEAADVWNEASSALDVAMADCDATDNVVPIDVLDLEGDVVGLWDQDTGRISLDGNQLDLGGITGWRKTICHEMGHALGLNHVEDSQSCMKQGEANTLPDQADFDQILTFYGGEPKADAATSEEVASEAETSSSGTAEQESTTGSDDSEVRVESPASDPNSSGNSQRGQCAGCCSGRSCGAGAGANSSSGGSGGGDSVDPEELTERVEQLQSAKENGSKSSSSRSSSGSSSSSSSSTSEVGLPEAFLEVLAQLAAALDQ